MAKRKSPDADVKEAIQEHNPTPEAESEVQDVSTIVVASDDVRLSLKKRTFALMAGGERVTCDQERGA